MIEVREGSDLMAERTHLDWFRERLASIAGDRAEGSGADAGTGASSSASANPVQGRFDRA